MDHFKQNTPTGSAVNGKNTRGPPWPGRSKICFTIMFLLVNKSRAKAFLHNRELLLSGNKVSAVNSMRELSAETFRQHLLETYSLPARARARVENPANSTLARPLREVWEATDLSSAEFADEVSDYWGVVRLSLPQLLASTPCLDGFSRRFLRESTIFPVRAPSGSYRLAVADPSDRAAIRAAEIVFGAPVEVAVASFEDITTLLDQRADVDGATAEEGARGSSQQSDDDIESLRDLASGAPVVRALNDLLERAVELRASAIHIEPFRTGLVVRMRVDGLLRAIPA